MRTAGQSMPDLKVAVVFISFGPYHLARAQALAALNGIAPHFIQLAESIGTHPWRMTDAQLSSIDLITLARQPYEETTYRQLAASLWALLDDLDPAVVMTASYRPFVMLSGARWAKAHGRRAVVFFENTPWDRPRHRLVERAKRAVIRRYYDAGFAGGRVHREYLTQLGILPARIWGPYDVVDNDYFARASRCAVAEAARWRRKLDLPTQYFLYVGRYSPDKNLRRLVEAYRMYRAECAASSAVRWPLLLVGDGPQRAELEAMASAVEGICLRPFAQIDELPAYYALAECLVLPSTVEPWGLVVNEAMASGLPVIVSQLCGCFPDLVEEGCNGFSFDPYDVADLAKRLAAIARLNRGEREQMGALSRQIIGHFTPQLWAQSLAQCARTIVSEDGI